MSSSHRMFATTPPGSLPGRRSRGFTLIELLVVLLVLTLLIAAVAPVVMQQAAAGDATRAAEDLQGIANATAMFRTNVGTFPGDLEDLVNLIAVGAPDTSVDSTLYSALQRNRWKGPYIDKTLSTGGDAGTALLTGFDGEVQWDLRCYRADSAVGNHRRIARHASNCSVGTPSSPRQVWVAAMILRLRLDGFNALNQIIDGPADTLSGGAGDSTSGRLRRFGIGATADTTVFLAVPIPRP